MGKNREKRAMWFKCFLSSKATIDAVPDAEVGRGVKAAFQYFATGEVMELDALSKVVFAAMRPYIDESLDEYARKVEGGSKGAENRWGGLNDE